MNPSPLPADVPVHWHRRVLGLAFPIVLANLTQPILGLVDTAVAGHLDGPETLGGVAVGGLFFSLVFWSFSFLRMCTTALVAHAHGARDALALRLNLARALLLATTIGMVLLAIQTPLIQVIVDVIGGSDAVRTDARLYSHARIWAAPVALLNYVVLGYLLGRQQVRVALLIQCVINTINILAVLLFVHGFGLGIRGIGAATALADGCGFALGACLLWHMRTPGLAPLQWSALLQTAALRRLLTLNRDIFFRTFFLLLSVGWFAHVGARQGDTILAANALLLNFQTFMAYGLDGFAHAAEALVGAACGARERDGFRQAVRTTLLWSVVGAIGIAAIYWVIGPFVIVHLTNQADVRHAAVRYLPWIAILPVASVGGYLMDGVFIGAMRTTELMWSMAACLLIFLAAALFAVSAWGNHGLWLSFTLYMFARGALLAWQLPKIDAQFVEYG